MLRNNLMLPTEALDIPEAIDFDGTNDYLSRSSDLVGNADGKTFTFSVWCDFRKDLASSFCKIYTNSGSTSYGFFVNYSPAGNNINFRAFNASGTVILDATATFKCNETFFNIVCSIDLTNTSKRSVYINDTPASVGYATYVNDTIAFAYPTHYISFPFLGQDFKGRLSNFYLDYQYRDLSIESNRRLFITADRKPAANQQALNPILYLPLNDPTQPGKNLGTGGDFNLTGVVARSGRGPNQFNAPYSDLDGTADYLSRTTALSGVADSKTITVGFNAFIDSGADNPVLYIGNGFSAKVDYAYIGAIYYQAITVQCYNASGTVILVAKTGMLQGFLRNYNFIMSFDLSDTSKRSMVVNGNFVSGIYDVYTNDLCDLDVQPINVGYRNSSTLFNGRLGNVFFDTKYIDLSQPANLAKFVTGTGIDAKPADLGANGELPFGTAPLIYLPMYGNNAGKNYGTGGDFTVNSGPFPGARGPNEFWGNAADFNGTTGYLARTSALVGVIDGKTFSCAMYINWAASQTLGFLQITNAANNRIMIYGVPQGGPPAYCGVQVVDGAGLVVDITATTFSNAGWYFIQIDTTAPNNCKIFYNNTLLSKTGNTVNDRNMPFSGNTAYVGWVPSANGRMSGKLAEFYFTTEYIDFSLEANRLKFRDAFGNPVELQSQIDAGTLPKPAIYMRFDPANFGKNSGTGGDFTVNGTITDGGNL